MEQGNRILTPDEAAQRILDKAHEVAQENGLSEQEEFALACVAAESFAG